MNALNEVNRVITSVSYYPQQSGPNSQGQVIGGNNQVLRSQKQVKNSPKRRFNRRNVLTQCIQYDKFALYKHNIVYLYQQNRQTQGGNANLAQEEEDFLTADRMAIWLKDNKVLQIVLQDSLHQPQYVEKLEKVIRFIIKEKSLTLEDLHDIWNAQVCNCSDGFCIDRMWIKSFRKNLWSRLQATPRQLLKPIELQWQMHYWALTGDLAQKYNSCYITAF